jgi:hypothetical protein
MDAGHELEAEELGVRAGFGDPHIGVTRQLRLLQELQSPLSLQRSRTTAPGIKSAEAKASARRRARGAPAEARSLIVPLPDSGRSITLVVNNATRYDAV